LLNVLLLLTKILAAPLRQLEIFRSKVTCQ
jgi:hypothetical protein